MARQLELDKVRRGTAKGNRVRVVWRELTGVGDLFLLETRPFAGQFVAQPPVLTGLTSASLARTAALTSSLFRANPVFRSPLALANTNPTT